MSNAKFLLVLKISAESVAFKSDQKFFLVRLSQLYPYGECRLSIKDLAVEMGVSDRVVSSGIKFWEDERVLIRREVWEKIEIRKRCVAYLRINWRRVGGLLSLQKLVMKDEGGDKGMAHIESLLNPRATKIKVVSMGECGASSLQVSKCFDLNISQRLLLIILLWSANPCGVVRGVGKAVLCQHAGVSRERLDAQIEALLCKGFLLAYLPGGSSRGIEGIYTATYFLNVNHNGFKSKSDVLTRSGGKLDFPIPRGKELIRNIHNADLENGEGGERVDQESVSLSKATLRRLIPPWGDLHRAPPIDAVLGGWFGMFWDKVDKSLLKLHREGIDDELHELVRRVGERSKSFREDASQDKDQILEQVADFICGYIWSVARNLQRFIALKEFEREECCVDYIPAGCKVYVSERSKMTLSHNVVLLVALTSDVE